jgi:hypothetical protein
MSRSVRKIAFGHIGNDAVIDTDTDAFIRAHGTRRWLKLPLSERQKIVRVRTRTFILRYEDLLDHLPRQLSGLIRPLRINGRLVSLCWRTSRTNNAGSSIVPFAPYLEKVKSRARTFHLGPHTYSAGPGYGWSCEYRIERLNNEGTSWDLCATDEETGEYQSMGTHSLEEAQDYFNGVSFSISREQWEAMGATFLDEYDQECLA